MHVNSFSAAILIRGFPNAIEPSRPGSPSHPFPESRNAAEYSVGLFMYTSRIHTLNASVNPNPVGGIYNTGTGLGGNAGGPGNKFQRSRCRNGG